VLQVDQGDSQSPNTTIRRAGRLLAVSMRV